MRFTHKTNLHVHINQTNNPLQFLDGEDEDPTFDILKVTDNGDSAMSVDGTIQDKAKDNMFQQVHNKKKEHKKRDDPERKNR